MINKIQVQFKASVDQDRVDKINKFIQDINNDNKYTVSVTVEEPQPQPSIAPDGKSANLQK